MSSPSNCFYRNFSDETCVGLVSELFKGLGNRETVSASLTGEGSGVSNDCMKAIHNHLDSSKTWARVPTWVTEVEYTIPHPQGDITAFDTNSGGDAKLFRNAVVRSIVASPDQNEQRWKIELKRTSSKPSDKMDFNTTRFSRVRVMNTKRFHYETERSSWVFKLVVCWEGATKEDAKTSDKRYFVYVETNDTAKTSSNPSYSAASFLDKIVDIISLEGKRRTILF